MSASRMSPSTISLCLKPKRSVKRCGPMTSIQEPSAPRWMNCSRSCANTAANALRHGVMIMDDLIRLDLEGYDKDYIHDALTAFLEGAPNYGRALIEIRMSRM